MQRISIDEMIVENIEEADIEAVKKLAKATKRKHLIFSFLALSACASLFFESGGRLHFDNIVDFFSYFIGYIIIPCLGIYNMKRFIKLTNRSISDLTALKKAQYGIINKKHINKSQINKRNTLGYNTYYYLKVGFPKYNTYTDCIRCSEKIYKKVSKEDRILLVSFDDKSLKVIKPVDL